MKALFKNIVVAVLTIEAQLILKKFKPEIIAITGSVGKTSAKDAIKTAIGGGYEVRASAKTLNSEIGVPLTIIGAHSQWDSVVGWLIVFVRGVVVLCGRTYPRTLILEVGADAPGDIERIASWIKPDIAVITGVPDMPVHVAFFESANAVLKEKAALMRHLKGGGTFIVNGDDARARSLIPEWHGKRLSYGLSEESDIRIARVESVIAEGKPHGDPKGRLLWYRGMRMQIIYRGAQIALELMGALGEPHALAIGAGCAVALARGEELPAIVKRFDKHETPPGRMRILEGVNGSTIIDDSYNSSPAAALSAIQTAALLPRRGRLILALGDMRELGTHSRSAHELVGKRASAADTLITVGEESRVLAEAARMTGLAPERIKSYGYGESAQAGRELKNELRPDDVVLVKGSQNMIRMECFVREIMAEPERARELLVRQESEWINRP